MIGPKLSDSGAITGGAQITCVEPPLSHHAGLYLEYHSAAGTRWQLENADKSSEIRVLADCRVGDWRLRYNATGADATGKPFDVTQTNAETPHGANGSSGGGKFGREGLGFVEQDVLGEAVVELADHLVEEVPLGGGVPVAGFAAALVVGFRPW